MNFPRWVWYALGAALIWMLLTRSLVKLALLIVAGFAALGLYYRVRLERAGLIVTSWWRSPWHNAAVGGTDFNTHLTFLAFDVVPVTQTARDRLTAIGFRKIINEGDHYHVEV